MVLGFNRLMTNNHLSVLPSRAARLKTETEPLMRGSFDAKSQLGQAQPFFHETALSSGAKPSSLRGASLNLDRFPEAHAHDRVMRKK
jgi:hypothetical protein